MKVSQIMYLGIFFIGIYSIEAQDRMSFSLEEAVHIAWIKSNEVSLANTKVNTKKYELQSVKNNQYPDFRVSGQYQRLAKAAVDLKINKNSSSTTAVPTVDQLMIGQANATLPIFGGFKIQNSIKLQDYLYQAETANSLQTKEDVAMNVVHYYASLYKAQKTIELLKENQKKAEQRVTVFNE